MNARAKNLTPEYSPPVEESTFAAVFRMSKPQLFLGWSMVGLMLVVVFLFGFYSGRKQGVELALTEQSVPRLRLPVESPKARAALSTAPVTAPAVSGTMITPPTKFDFTDSKPDSFAIESDSDSKTQNFKPEPRIDHSAGFVAKAANELVNQPAAIKQEFAQTLEPVEQSLAERVAHVELSPALSPPSGAGSVKVEKEESRVEPIVKNAPTKIAPTTPVKNQGGEAKVVSLISNKNLGTKQLKPEVAKPGVASATGLFVQVGAPDSFSKAQTIVSKLKAQGLTAAIRDVSVNHKQHYRVLVGPFSSRDSAQNAKNQVIKSGLAMGEPFIKNY